MSVDEICRLGVEELTEKDAVLFFVGNIPQIARSPASD